MPGISKFTHNSETQALQLVKCLWKEILNRGDIDVTDLLRKPSQLLFDAAELGNFEFLAELICSFPDLVHELDDNNRSIFHVAVLHRHANIFNLIFEIGFTKELISTFKDNRDNNNILHLAAKYPHPSRVSIVSGAALQMQRELLWFKVRIEFSLLLYCARLFTRKFINLKKKNSMHLVINLFFEFL